MKTIILLFINCFCFSVLSFSQADSLNFKELKNETPMRRNFHTKEHENSSYLCAINFNL